MQAVAVLCFKSRTVDVLDSFHVGPKPWYEKTEHKSLIVESLLAWVMDSWEECHPGAPMPDGLKVRAPRLCWTCRACM